MTEPIRVSIEPLDVGESEDGIVDVHHLSCKIHHDGDANIEKYFYANVKSVNSESVSNSMNSGAERYTSSIRGRPLNGKLIALPQDTMGVVFDTSNIDRWKTVETFDKVMHWVLDSNPDEESTGIQGALSWMNISKAVCAPFLSFFSKHAL